MQGKTKERWMELCEQAAQEQDGKKLLELVREINRLLREKRERLNRASAATVNIADEDASESRES